MTAAPLTMLGVRLVGHTGPVALVRIPAAVTDKTEITSQVGRRGQHAGCAAGRLGAAGFPRIKGDLRAVTLDDQTLPGSAARPRAVFADFVTIIRTAPLRPAVVRSFSVRDHAGPLADLSAGRCRGKPVPVPSEPQP